MLAHFTMWARNWYYNKTIYYMTGLIYFISLLNDQAKLHFHLIFCNQVKYISKFLLPYSPLVASLWHPDTVQSCPALQFPQLSDLRQAMGDSPNTSTQLHGTLAGLGLFLGVWLYLYFLNILFFFKYSCTNTLHRLSPCTFYWET